MDSLRNEILRVKNKDRPYTETDIVYDSLVAVIKSRHDMVTKAQKLYAAKGTLIPQSVFNHRAKDLETIFKFFSYTDRVDSPRIPFEVLRSLSWVANDLFGEKCYAVVRLEPEYNYAILSCRREFERNGWGQYWQYAPEEDTRASGSSDRKAAPNVLLLGFPSPDAGSTLVHALAAHEFGHEFAHKWNDDLTEVREQVVSEVKSFYNTVLQDYTSGIFRRQEGESQDDVSEKARKYLLALIESISSSWLKEIFSDLAAARLVGPAFLAAFDRIIIGHGKGSEKYPPASLRRSLVRRYLEKLLPQVISDPTWAQLFDNSALVDLPSDELFRVMQQVFDGVIDKLIPILNRIPSPLTRLKANELSDLLETMEEHIDNLAPPSVPLSVGDKLPDTEKFWLLVFVAWHYRLSDRFDELRRLCGDDTDSARAEEILGNLLLHSLQSLELRARWHEAMNQKRSNVH